MRIGVDTGGTFTDLVLTGADNRVRAVTKVPSTPADPASAVLDAVAAAADILGCDSRELLAGCETFAHGSTVATNIVLERKGARTALICTEGFRDTLAIRRGKRETLWDLKEPRHVALVPRRLRLGIAERTDRDGKVERAPEVAGLEHAAALIEAGDVESVAVCLFNSPANPANEDIVAEFLDKRLPDVHVSVSSRLVPLIGEYERTSTAVLDAYVAPSTIRYLTSLRDQLHAAGLRTGALLMAQSNGGLIDVGGCIARPVLTLLSGPSTAGGAARLYVEETKPGNDFVVFDMGGTSCDVTLVRGGVSSERETTTIDAFDSAVPSVDVHTIGTGGGTIARVDQSGLLRVGPDSSGADPGPACFGKGSATASVTDANLVLDRLGHRSFADGHLVLRTDLAERALRETVAEPAGVDVTAAALGVVALADQQMAEAIRLMSVERGADPRELVLVAAGGAAGLHAATLARELEMRAVYVPRYAPILCALGLLQADVEHDEFRALVCPLDDLEPARLRTVVGELREHTARTLAERGIDLSGAALAVYAGTRYEGHQTTIAVELAGPDADDAVAALATAFHARHEQLYGFARPYSRLEMTYVRLSVRLSTARPRVHDEEHGAAGDVVRPVQRRRLTYPVVGEVATDVYDGADLAPGAGLAGPALVRDSLTTVLVLPGQTLRVDGSGSFLITEGTAST